MWSVKITVRKDQLINVKMLIQLHGTEWIVSLSADWDQSPPPQKKNVKMLFGLKWDTYRTVTSFFKALKLSIADPWMKGYDFFIEIEISKCSQHCHEVDIVAAWCTNGTKPDFVSTNTLWRILCGNWNFKMSTTKPQGGLFVAVLWFLWRASFGSAMLN